YQRRLTRWYTHLEINLWPVWEGDGHPRLFTEPMQIKMNEVFVGQERRRKDWPPDPSPWFSSRSRVEPYLPYTKDDRCAELLVIYRQYYPDDPPPNPERDSLWDGAARLLTRKVPERMTSRWSLKVQSGLVEPNTPQETPTTVIRQVIDDEHHGFDVDGDLID